jgi:hypothetical protein
MDDFEQRLSRQPLKGPPAEYRAVIMDAANSMIASEGPFAEVGKKTRERPWFAQLVHGCLWPHPAAWGALAAVWLLLFLVQTRIHFDIQGEIELAGTEISPAGIMTAFENRQWALEQMLASANLEIPAADRPRRSPPTATGSPPLMILNG